MMTYKKMVAHLVEQEAWKWAEQVTGCSVINSEPTEIHIDEDTIYWEVKVEVRDESFSPPLYRPILVGGTACDMCGICKSVIWNADKSKILWMSVEATREQLGITEFKF